MTKRKSKNAADFQEELVAKMFTKDRWQDEWTALVVWVRTMQEAAANQDFWTVRELWRDRAWALRDRADLATAREQFSASELRFINFAVTGGRNGFST